MDKFEHRKGVVLTVTTVDPWSGANSFDYELSDDYDRDCDRLGVILLNQFEGKDPATQVSVKVKQL